MNGFMIGADYHFEMWDLEQERWEKLPWSWKRPSAGAVMGVKVPPKPPKLDGFAALADMLKTISMLLDKGYKLRGDMLVQEKMKPGTYFPANVQIWYLQDGELKHIYGIGLTMREAYAQADRMMRAAKSFGSYAKAIAHGIAQAERKRYPASTRLHEDFEDEGECPYYDEDPRSMLWSREKRAAARAEALADEW